MRSVRAFHNIAGGLAASVALGICLAGEHAVNWHTIDAGGGASAGSPHAISGTIGQPDAGVMTGGTFELTGGFWAAAATVTPVCLGDLDGDGQVGLSDLLLVLSDFGCTTDCPGDANGDDETGLIDLLLVLSNFGLSCLP